ncbi:MAG: hypothetical protein JZU62_09530 [Sulfuricurvum sp.]|uniref:hypothetical protein n=1 Tax=Sulfuricurvum sp. TaxID=2025608 RepID=UPI0025F953E5|nr:hypothetical protein [Sulfuricurvum sp.]MBV5321918.1 hypothetical protein [Sulfuricurvum sp.]
MKDNEPTLESIEDYDTLKGSKKRTVWTVIVIGLFIGIILVATKSYYSSDNDSIPVEDAIGKVPVK